MKWIGRLTETTTAEAARARPASLAASAQRWAREQVRRAPAVGSTPNDLETAGEERREVDDDRSLAGTMRVAAAWREAAMVVSS